MKVKLTPIGNLESAIILENVVQITKVADSVVYISRKENNNIVGKTVNLCEWCLLVYIDESEVETK